MDDAGPLVIVDHREQGAETARALAAAGARLEFRALRAGDYRSGEALIERKTYWDFGSSAK